MSCKSIRSGISFSKVLQVARAMMKKKRLWAGIGFPGTKVVRQSPTSEHHHFSCANHRGESELALSSLVPEGRFPHPPPSMMGSHRSPEPPMKRHHQLGCHSSANLKSSLIPPPGREVDQHSQSRTYSHSESTTMSQILPFTFSCSERCHGKDPVCEISRHPANSTSKILEPWYTDSEKFTQIPTVCLRCNRL